MMRYLPLRQLDGTLVTLCMWILTNDVLEEEDGDEHRDDVINIAHHDVCSDDRKRTERIRAVITTTMMVTSSFICIVSNKYVSCVYLMLQEALVCQPYFNSCLIVTKTTC